MIITCNNCNKKFDADSSAIPETGRLLQCSSCNHKWFFKKKLTDKPIETNKLNKPIERTETDLQREESLEVEKPRTIKLLDDLINNNFVPEEKILFNINKTDKNEDKNDYHDPEIFTPKKRKNNNILSLTIIFIISFIALIIILDTFQKPISKVIPNIEFILYNLYETINDIMLFLGDLI
jgi:predicted Zn finger-like uncharacterized protein